MAEGAVQELAHDGEPEIAGRQLQHLEIPELALIAPIRQIVFGTGLSFGFARQLEPECRLSQAVEGDVGKGDVFFQDRAVPTPLGEAMAQDQAIIALAEEKLD
jgi:hypothetical protein